MIKHWTNALPLILVLFVSTIVSKATSAAERRVIGATIAAVTREPQPNSPMLLQLRLGDIVSVIERKDNYSKIQYRIDDEFPVEGWVPSAALTPAVANDSKSLNAKNQPYTPKEKAKIDTQVNEFPSFVGQAGSPSIDLLPKSSAPAVTDTPHAVAAFIPNEWNPRFSLELGSVSFQENLKTMDPRSASAGYYSGSFLSYELNGAAITAEGTLGYDMDFAILGGIFRYSFMYFSDGISGNDYVNTSNLQAQMHSLQIGPTLKKKFELGRWILIPELRVLAAYQNLATNQLSDARQNQPVLMSLMNYEGRIEFLPRLELPFDQLFFEPFVGVSIFNSFSESPQITVDANGAALSDDNKIRTGTPKSKAFQIHYGANLGMRLSDWDLPEVEVFFRGSLENLSREYSGIGNRAGFKVSNVKTDSKLIVLSLGFRRFF